MCFEKKKKSKPSEPRDKVSKHPWVLLEFFPGSSLSYSRWLLSVMNHDQDVSAKKKKEIDYFPPN